ncbi:MAG TPA: EAL domain-containing protein [Gemmatimonadales bacterium]|jgi:EAL domain-containing protein (putative c-di-GMP-specific phosphodiesterase class I)|nr:EAL domain-containing protein [Gemmatimonadales bacterium]
MGRKSQDLQHVLQQTLRRAGGRAVKNLLFDSVTALPGFQTLLPQVSDMLSRRSRLGLLTLSIAKFSQLEEVYGWESFDQIVRGVASCMKSVKEDVLRAGDAIAELMVNGYVFVLLLSPPRHKHAVSQRDLARVKARLSAKLEDYLAKVLSPDLRQRFAYVIGTAIIKNDPALRMERVVYRAIDQALTDATSDEESLRKGRSRKLLAILDQRRITTLYQPIVDLRSRAVLGYEALSRGPPGDFHTPDVLFSAAYETDLIWRLERLCRQHALRAIGRLEREQLLFVNMEPLSIFDPELPAGVPPRYLGRLVLEITERAAIKDFSTFRQAVQVVKAAGFRFAIDDVGSAYAGLRVISEIQPQFIKLDMELTRGAHDSRVKMQLLEAVAGFCRDAGVPIVVEGVETREELAAVARVGIHLVQGYLLGRPSPAPWKAPKVPDIDLGSPETTT